MQNRRIEGKKDRRRQEEMKELQKIAMAYYQVSSPSLKALADNFYRSMDNNGERMVNFSKFQAFMKRKGPSMKHEGHLHMCNNHFFSELNLDGNGILSFSEVIMLHYIVESKRPFCDACGQFIPGTFFSCVQCLKASMTSFNLCRGCYCLKTTCLRNHRGGTLFLDNHMLLEVMRHWHDHSSAETSQSGATRRTQTHAHVTNSHPALHPPSPVQNHTNAIVPATNTIKKKSATLEKFGKVVKIGCLVATTFCAIM